MCEAIFFCDEPISGQCSHFIPLEKTRKSLVFWCFQGVLNRNIGQKWVTAIQNHRNPFLTNIQFYAPKKPVFPWGIK